MPSLLPFIAVLVCGWLLRPTAVAACTPPVDPRVPQSAVTSAPANGVIVILEAGLLGAEGAGAAVEVVDTVTDEIVQGEVVHESYGSWGATWIAFRPDAPLIEGRTYEATRAESVFTFEAQPAVTWSIDAIAMSASIEMHEYLDESIGCSRPQSAECESPYIPLAQLKYLAIEPSVDLAAVEQAADQFVVSFAAWLDGDAEPQISMPNMRGELLHTRFDAVADAYCYRVTLTSLIDGSEAMHEACIDNTFGDARALTPTAASEEEVTSGIRSCQRWLGDELSEFCAAREWHCASDTTVSVDPCAVRERLCMNEVAPQAAPDASEPDASEPGERESLTEPPSAAHEAGCSATHGARSDAGAVFVFFALAAALLRRTRYRA
jgi:hypothetical protein